MRLPTPLSRRKSNVHKNQFGHVLVLAGSQRMLGAAALTSLAAIRSGSGLVTVGVPKSLNTALQKKVSNEIMTWPLPETLQQSLSLQAFVHIKKALTDYTVIAIGPGLSRDLSTQKLILKIIASSNIPLVIDADALNALVGNLHILRKTKTQKILTPHPGEMARLIAQNKSTIEKNRMDVTRQLAQKYRCTILLKGAKTIVASPGKNIYTNTSGNAGMATAGSGDVLTGIIAAFLAQGLTEFDAAKFGAYIHGKAGDLAAKHKTRTSMIASDIIEYIPETLKLHQSKSCHTLTKK